MRSVFVKTPVWYVKYVFYLFFKFPTFLSFCTLSHTHTHTQNYHPYVCVCGFKPFKGSVRIFNVCLTAHKMINLIFIRELLFNYFTYTKNLTLM